MSEIDKSNRNVYYSCHYHMVWCPKYRRKVLIGPIETRLKEIIAQVCQECQAEVEELEIMPDHYFVGTTGGSALSLIKQYIEQQKRV